MQTLILFRHAKSSWDDPDCRDFDRPLNTRGRAAATRMGAYLAESGFVPDLILCSSALRTRQTAALALAKVDDAPSPEYLQSLYLAEAGRLLEVIRETPANARTLMLIGHNPGFHELALELIGASTGDALRGLQHKLPTAALAVIEFETSSWRQVGPKSGTLTSFVVPRDLDD